VSFERYAVVRVPFPFTDRDAAKNRPALVLSAPAFNVPAGHSVLAMITSTGNAPWPLDYRLTDLAAAGLPAPSMVRFKLFTLDHRLIRSQLGRLAATDASNVDTALKRLLDIAQDG
jgi:mRNA interferase MazF